MNRRHASVGIVGGSLVGPFAELMMRYAGFENVTTYEAMDGAWPQAGGVIGVRETGFDALHAADIPLDEIVAYKGHEVITYDIADKQVVRQRDFAIYPGETTSWDIFHDAVASRVPIHFGHRVKKMTECGTLVFSNGETAHHDLVVFADGRTSTGRRLLDPARKPSYQGYVVWRGLTDAVPDVKGFTRYRNNDHANLFSITEPVIRGANVGKTDWTWYENFSHEQYVSAVGKDPTKKGFLLPQDFTPGLRRHVMDYAEQYLPDKFVSTVETTPDYMGVAMNDVPMPARGAFRVGNTRAILLGDALMVVRPHSGRGINNGIDQAWSLAQHLTRTSDVDEALIQWQAEVIPWLLEWVQLGVGRAQRNGFGIRIE
jgi:2,6-dihydroxypyridine 3-monooxygenase